MKNNDELRNKLNELKELKDLKYFINDYDKYKIIIKKYEYDFCGCTTTKRKRKVSKQVLLDFINYQIEKLKEEIEWLKKE